MFQNDVQLSFVTIQIYYIISHYIPHTVDFIPVTLYFVFFFLIIIYFHWRLITILWFLPYIDMNQPWYTCAPHPETPFHLLPHPIFQGYPSAPALSTVSHASNLDWRSVSHMIIYMFQCYSLKSSHRHLLPHSPKVCSLHLCLCYLTYRVIVIIFLNSICMR